MTTFDSYLLIGYGPVFSIVNRLMQERRKPLNPLKSNCGYLCKHYIILYVEPFSWAIFFLPSAPIEDTFSSNVEPQLCTQTDGGKWFN